MKLKLELETPVLTTKTLAIWAKTLCGQATATDARMFLFVLGVFFVSALYSLIALWMLRDLAGIW